MLLSITDFKATGFNRFKHYGLQTDAEEVSISPNALNDTDESAKNQVVQTLLPIRI